MPPENDLPATTLDELKAIKLHLERLDRRDRLRTIGGFFRSIIALIPMILFLVGTWYFYKHGDEIIGKISQQAAQKAAEMAKQNPSIFLPQGKINDLLNDPASIDAIRNSMERYQGQE